MRETGRRTGAGIRTATPYGILAFLTASAVAPVVGASLGTSGEVSAALNQLGGMGGNNLADTLSGVANRLRERDTAPSPNEWRDAVAQALQPLLAADGERAEGLRADVGQLLREVDAVHTALSASAESDVQLRDALAGAFRDLGADVGELRWMLTDVGRVLDGLQDQVAAESLQIHQRLDELRQQMVTVVRLRQEPVAGNGDPPRRKRSGRAKKSGPAADGAVCPYPGLASFQPEDADWFHGREDQVSVMLGRLAEQVLGGPPLVVTGVSGVGKSSLLRAGLLPAIAAGGLGEHAAAWPWLLMAPGPHPLAELVHRAQALASPGIQDAATLDTITERPRRRRLPATRPGRQPRRAYPRPRRQQQRRPVPPHRRIRRHPHLATVARPHSRHRVRPGRPHPGIGQPRRRRAPLADRRVDHTRRHDTSSGDTDWPRQRRLRRGVRPGRPDAGQRVRGHHRGGVATRAAGCNRPALPHCQAGHPRRAPGPTTDLPMNHHGNATETRSIRDHTRRRP